MSLYNLRNPAVKRLMREAEELRYPTKEYHAQPLEDNLFEWHFTLSGPPNTEFEGGIYHGRITLPPDYPMKPPSIILLTPNGRFETNKKICLSISGYHPESWQPSWSIRTALVAIIGFLPTHGNGAIGSLDYTPEERKTLAKKSQNWKCLQCGDIKKFLIDKENDSTPEKEISQPLNAVPQKLESVSEVKTEASSIPTTNLQPDEINNYSENIEPVDESNTLHPPEQKENSEPFQPSTSTEENTNLRCRNQSHLIQNNPNTVQSNELTTTSHSNWSLGAIWVIVFLLGILVCRRIIY